MLTAAPAGEVRGATWSEVDLETCEWRVPATRMKRQRSIASRCPMPRSTCSSASDRLLRGPADLVFPSPLRRDKPLSNMTWTKLLREQGIDAVPHGFRSSFRDWCAETGKAREVAEAALAHTVGGVEGAYFRSDLFERRRLVMQGWADFLTGGPRRSSACAVRRSPPPMRDPRTTSRAAGRRPRDAHHPAAVPAVPMKQDVARDPGALRLVRRDGPHRVRPGALSRPRSVAEGLVAAHGSDTGVRRLGVPRTSAPRWPTEARKKPVRQLF